MNKKRLSVVMAGAMLASSVAPVLAAETVVNESERGLLIKRLRELLESKKFSNIQANNDALDGTEDAPGESVYYIRVNGSDIYRLSQISALEKALQEAQSGTKIEVVDRGHIEKDGIVYNHNLEDVLITETYDAKELENICKNFNDGNHKADFSDAIFKMEMVDGALKVYVRTAETENKHVVKTYNVGDKEVEFSKPMNKNGLLLTDTDDWKDFDHFREWKHVDETQKKGSNIKEKVIETITLTDIDKVYETVLSDLYNGVFLTDKGQKLLDTMKEYDANGYTISGENDTDIVSDGRGIYELNITFTKTVNKATIKQVVNIKTNDKEKLTLFANGIESKTNNGHSTKYRKFPVQKLAGSNREETAVKVARENADIKTVSQNGNIVLVNRDSLVDGLAAAPLAASVSNMENKNSGNALAGHFVAPILLTNTNGLSKVTKDYMKEVIAHQQVGALNKVTVYLVGGEAVISKAVENELKEIGFRVVRAGGKDREETSLKVAKLMQDDTTAGDGYDNDDTKEAFVVGADGEADAMSVAAYAADNKAPIIVESRKGISEESIEFLKGYKNKSSLPTTIIGGETVVSEATETKLKEEKLTVDRISGSNRQATNAEVIAKLYGAQDIDHVVVSKDGKGNNGQLIDALTATSLAAKHHAPIVLATNNLTTGQTNSLELKAKATGVYVYQVGEGVAESVIKTIATRIGLAK